MSQIPNINGTPSRDQPFGSASALNDVNLDDFLKLMITELQNQDPLNPLENDQLLAQISQIREIGATEQLASTLDAVLLGQSIASATNLIGAEIEAISDDNQRVTGLVESVSILDGIPKLHIDNVSKAKPSDEPGEIGAGTYRYRVAWTNEAGEQFAIDPITSDGLENGIQLSEEAQSVLISGLPITSTAKHIYRTDGTGAGNFRFVATLSNGQSGSYLDTTSDANLSQSVLQGTPQLLDKAERSFTVSLSNVGEIRPPGR